MIVIGLFVLLEGLLFGWTAVEDFKWPNRQSAAWTCAVVSTVFVVIGSAVTGLAVGLMFVEWIYGPAYEVPNINIES